MAKGDSINPRLILNNYETAFNGGLIVVGCAHQNLELDLCFAILKLGQIEDFRRNHERRIIRLEDSARFP